MGGEGDAELGPPGSRRRNSLGAFLLLCMETCWAERGLGACLAPVLRGTEHRNTPQPVQGWGAAFPLHLPFPAPPPSWKPPSAQSGVRLRQSREHVPRLVLRICV